MEGENMKKTIFVILILVLVVLAVSCKKNETPQPSNDVGPVQDTAVSTPLDNDLDGYDTLDSDLDETDTNTNDDLDLSSL